jgi:hypothetical protein
MRFRREGLANAKAILFGAGSIRRQAAAPDISLSIEVIQISKFPGCEEARADVSNRSFDPAFFIPSGWSAMVTSSAFIPPCSSLLDAINMAAQNF